MSDARSPGLPDLQPHGPHAFGEVALLPRDAAGLLDIGEQRRVLDQRPLDPRLVNAVPVRDEGVGDIEGAAREQAGEVIVEEDTRVAEVVDLGDFGVFEDRDVEPGRLFGLGVEPEKWVILWAMGSSVSRELLVVGR